MDAIGNLTEEGQPPEAQTGNLPALGRLIQELFGENEKSLSQLKGINRKAWLLCILLNPEGELGEIITHRNMNTEGLLDNVVILVKALLHDCESNEREKLELQGAIADLETEGKEQEEEKEGLELVNAALEAENTALKRELKARRNGGRKKNRKRR